MLKTIIIGSGPAALTAAIYASRAGIEPVVLASTVKAGGELMNTTDVENYPGFPEGILGPELMDAFTEQALKFGTDIRYEDVIKITPNGESHTVQTDNSTYETRTIIYATGSEYKKLGLPQEEELTGHGISYCATCDGFFFKEKQIIVAGGGDSATEDALFLTRFSEVKLLVRGDSMKAALINQQRVADNPKIQVLYNTEIETLHQENNSLRAVTVISAGEKYELAADGLFIAIGSNPNTHLLHGIVELTPNGVIKVEHPSTATTVRGIFAAGDVTDDVYRQAVVAAGSGAKAALDVQAFLEAEGFGD